MLLNYIIFNYSSTYSTTGGSIASIAINSKFKSFVKCRAKYKNGFSK